MKKLFFLFLVLAITACASQDKKSESSDQPKVYGSIRMGVEGGKTTSNNSHMGIKNY